ncbi:hypothetical protein [Streptomyces lacrimifluminis]|uniref:hypothetical protein n=1 Tax=Streptomyces lacrimifluminis TaxID=1500077 RepID=UPI001E6303B9|nr:hypothetical protein [Streptomyces lacrimifluminis]
MTTTQHEDELPPARGALVYDPVVCKAGEYQDVVGPYAMLRPVGGGREWQADPALIRPATPAECLSAEVKAANERAGRAL